MYITFADELSFEAIKALINSQFPDVQIGTPAVSADGRRLVRYDVPWADAVKLKAARTAEELFDKMTLSDTPPSDWVSAEPEPGA